MPKLTKRVVDELKPDPAREVFAWDTELRGFGVRMMPTGVASFILKYRNEEGRQRKLAIGRVGSLTPEEARSLARQRLAAVARGEDPSGDRKALRKSMTIAELADAYLDEARARVKASTYSMYVSTLDRHIRPLLGTRTVAGITAQDVAKMQADIVAGKTSKPRKGRGGATTGGKVMAGRCVGMLGAILEMARQRKLVTENVARDVTALPSGKVDRFLSLDEIAKLGEAMRAAETERDNETGIAAIRFLLLGGCRRSEALELRLEWVDRAAGCIRFPETKRQGSYSQIRPIGAAAFAVLGASKAGWAFPADRGTGNFVGIRKVLDRLCKRAGLEGVTVHVLRHSFAATAAEMGFSELTIAGLLGHKKSSVTARYAKVPDSTLVIAADRVSARIADALTGKTERGKVVPLRGAS